MPKNDLFTHCYVKRLELLTKYFGDFAHVAAIEKPEQLCAIYTDDLPEKICDEFRNYLAGLWRDITPEGGRSFKGVLDRQSRMDTIMDDYDDYFPSARVNALKITLKERILKSNHKDVTFYNGLLKQCTEELLDVMIDDFIEDVH